MLPGQKTSSQRAVGHDGDVVRGAVVAQSLADIADGEVVVVLDHAETRAKGTELIERDVAGSESLHGQFFERRSGLQRGVMPLMQVKQVGLLDAETSQTVRDVNPVIRRQDLRGDGDAFRLSRSQPLAEDRFGGSTTVSGCGCEVRDDCLLHPPYAVDENKGCNPHAGCVFTHI